MEGDLRGIPQHPPDGLLSIYTLQSLMQCLLGSFMRTKTLTVKVMRGSSMAPLCSGDCIFLVRPLLPMVFQSSFNDLYCRMSVCVQRLSYEKYRPELYPHCRYMFLLSIVFEFTVSTVCCQFSMALRLSGLLQARRMQRSN